MRLIDADALGIGRANPDVFEKKAYAWGWNSAIDVIEAAPTIDAVPVVRCKDCKHHRMFLNRDMCAKNAIVLNDHEIGLRATGKDEFCSYGERKYD